MKQYAVIMAGGQGTRFWPESRSEKPKQFLTLIGNRSLIQQSYDRLKDLFPPHQVLVVVGSAHLDLAQRQLPDLPPENFLVEPIGKNTAPCIGLAAVHIRKRDPGATMLIFPADHMIQGLSDFHLCLKKGIQWAAKSDYLVTIGIMPSRPDTGYGYVEREEVPIDNGPSVYSVKRFVEKPDLDTAMEFIKSGRYYWNSGIFIWRVDLILSKIQQYLPELYSGLIQIENNIGTDGEDAVMRTVFNNLEAISIDYGILEKSHQILLVQGDFGWDDLGSWGALADTSASDSLGMVVQGDYVGIDNTNCFIHGQNLLIAALGVHDLVIVQSGNVVLVCDKKRTQEVRNLLQQVKEQNMEHYI